MISLWSCQWAQVSQVNQNVIYLIRFIITVFWNLIVNSPWLFLSDETETPIKFRMKRWIWHQLVNVMWPSDGHSTVNHHNWCIATSHVTSQWSQLETLLWNHYDYCFVINNHLISFWCDFDTRRKAPVMGILQWSIHIIVIWELPNEFTTKLPGNSSQNNSTLRSPTTFESNKETNIMYHILVHRSDYDTCNHLWCHSHGT